MHPRTPMVIAAALAVPTLTTPITLAANLTFYANEADFLAATESNIVEDYEGLPNTQNSDATMNSYYNETVYETTAGAVQHQTWNGYYNATNASFRLHFDQTSITADGGIHAVATSYASYDDRWVYFLHFADGSTEEITLPEAPLGSETFMAFSSDVPIVSLHMCVTGDTPSTLNGTFWLETLTLGAQPNPTTLYTDSAAFLAATSSHAVEDFEGIANSADYSDAQMSAFYNETRYESTYLPDRHQVFQGMFHCWNVSARLHFDTSSLTENGGVFGVGLRFANYDDRWHLFITFADGSTEEHPLPLANIDAWGFFGIASEKQIASIHICAQGNQPQLYNGASFFEDIILAAAPPVPCPGDLDNDADNDVFDFGLFVAAFGSSTGDPNFDPAADFDNSGAVNVLDFATFALGFGCSP